MTKAKGTQEYAFVDAKEPLTFHVTKHDIQGATPGSGKNCVLSRCGRREHGCFDITLFRTCAYIRWKETTVPERYMITASAKDQIVAFDASGRAHPITVTFVPPKGARSAAYNRSHDRKERKNKQRQQKRVAKSNNPRLYAKRRAYTRPSPLTLLGVRNGQGWRAPGSGRMDY